MNMPQLKLSRKKGPMPFYQIWAPDRLNPVFFTGKKGILKEYNVEVIGVNVDAIEEAETGLLLKKP
jgi:hypothetical protein